MRELVVLSHLRWGFVWQRPQHLISRLSAGYDRTWFVEEPVAAEGANEPSLRVEERGAVTCVVLELPGDSTPAGFDATACELYARLLPPCWGPSTTARCGCTRLWRSTSPTPCSRLCSCTT